MNPHFLNRFMKKLTRDRVVPTIFAQRLLTDLRNHRFGNPFLAKMSEHKKDAGQPFLAGIKQLVNQIFFVADIPRQQECDEEIGKGRFPVKRIHHGPFLNSQNSAICHCGCSADAESLTRKRTFTEETPLTQYADRGFLAILWRQR